MKRKKARVSGKRNAGTLGAMAVNGNEALAAEPDTPFSVTPLLGALLRVTHEALTLGILESLRRQGIDMSKTEFSVMRYPGPDGLRPIDLARRCNMTKQAMNYVLAGFESKGYIERRSPAGQRSTTILFDAEGLETAFGNAALCDRDRGPLGRAYRSSPVRIRA